VSTAAQRLNPYDEIETLREKLMFAQTEAERAQTQLTGVRELLAQLDLTKASTFAAWEKKRAALLHE
jgi:hypothetical protein